MDYRIEDKYIVTDRQWAVIECGLREICCPDAHGHDGLYQVRSVYFDDMMGTCLAENEAGLDHREKFRLRIYDAQDAPVHLERKTRYRGRTKKEALSLRRDEAERLIAGDTGVCFAADPDGRDTFLLKNLGAQMLTRRLQPVILIEYERRAYTYPAGNVRITCDSNIGSSADVAALWGRPREMVPVLPPGQHILEIKYDELLPDYIRRTVDIERLRRTSFSKFYYGSQPVNERIFAVGY